MKGAYTCENCRFTNVLDPDENLKRTKKRHPLWVDNFTWRKFKALAADFDNMGTFLDVLLANYSNQNKLQGEVVFG